MTAAQSEAILAAVHDGGNVFPTAAGFLSALNSVAATSFNDLSPLLVPDTKLGVEKATLGCCICSSGQIPNLTQLQCRQFTGSTWTQPPDCTDQKP